MKLASKIGSDVPFFIEGKTCLVSGIGNKIKKIDSDLKLNFLIVKPNINISTKWAYNEFDKYNKKISKINKNNNKNLINALKENNLKKIAENLHNDFEAVIIKKYPIIKKINNDLIKNNALNVIMTGSGSAVFGIFENKDNALSAYKKLKGKYNFACLSQSF